MRRKLVYGSPWVLAAACTLLAIIITAFALNNYSREKTLMTEVLVQKGLAVIRYIDSGLGVSIRSGWRMRSEGHEGWLDQIQVLMDQIQLDDIHFVEVVNREGIVLASSSPGRVGSRVEKMTLEFLKDVKPSESGFRFSESHYENEVVQGFQVAKRYNPRMGGMMSQHMKSHGRGHNERMFRGQKDFERFAKEFRRVNPEGVVLLVELDIEQFKSAVKRQLFFIVILSLVLLLVGIGGWLSLLTIQGFKGTQSKLRRISAFNDLLVESLPIGLIATDGDGLVRTVNEEAAKIVGINQPGMFEQKPEKVLPVELAQLIASTSHTRVKGQEVTKESQLTRSDGNVLTLLLTALPVSDKEGVFSGDVLLMQDISKTRLLESELRRSERLAALGKMAAGVAHELRNPLSSIKGLAVLLKGKLSGDEEGEKTVDVLVQEVERLNRSISELLDYARPQQLEKKRVSLADIFAKAKMLVEVDAEQLDIAITGSIPDGTGMVWADADKMNQVFLNLLLNSIQAIDDGGEISVAIEEEGDSVVCTIADTGSGVSEENLSRIFDPYFTTKNDGTGLGLALSAKIVEEHEGNISITSKEGEGSCVKVILPLV